MTIQWAWNFSLENEQVSHMSFKNYEDSGYDLNVDLLTISFYHVFHILGENGLVEICIY